MDTPSNSTPLKKPRMALAIATCFGLGYIPKAPGTAGSLAGVALVWFVGRPFLDVALQGPSSAFHALEMLVYFQTAIALLVGVLGVVSSHSVAAYLGTKDPQRVVIDEVSGQQIALLLAPAWDLNWKYFVLGFILFRAFDIWKPFPARRAEKLPGGWGIMADDWVAGVYAAAGLWLARALGL